MKKLSMIALLSIFVILPFAVIGDEGEGAMALIPAAPEATATAHAGQSGLIGNMSTSAIIWALVFSSIGGAFFFYGKKKENMLIMLVSGALAGYPYLVQDTKLIIIIGVLLTGVLWMVRK